LHENFAVSRSKNRDIKMPRKIIFSEQPTLALLIIHQNILIFLAHYQPPLLAKYK